MQAETYMKRCRRKKKEEKYLFDVTVSEEDYQKQYHIFRRPLSSVSVINSPWRVILLMRIGIK